MRDRSVWSIGPHGPDLGGRANQGVRDPFPDGLFPGAHPRERLGTRAIQLAARLGLSLFITGGFAVAACLNPGAVSPDDELVALCVAVFLWTFALIWSTT